MEDYENNALTPETESGSTDSEPDQINETGAVPARDDLQPETAAPEASAPEAQSSPAPAYTPPTPYAQDGARYSRPETERSAYSDAGYVPSADASVVPRSYHCAAPAPEKKPKKEKRPRRGMPAAAVVALCVVCALLGGLAAGAFGIGYIRKHLPAESEAEDTVIRVAAPAASPVTTDVVSSGDVMTPSEIYYNLALDQVVGVTTEITYTNFWGYTSSSAVSGSGFVISENGYVLTNYHVIENAVKGGYEVKVLNYAGEEYVAAVIGYEEDNDVAVLKIEASGLNAATIGDSDSMRVGEMVYPVGNPLGELQYTMTDGMVSALDREIRSYDSVTQTYKSVNMFQISAAINSGNSGGPVYNNRGEVIGIATAKYSQTGVESLGFAIPINDAIKIANDLITDGYVRGKAYLGVTAGTVTASAAQYYGLVEGAIIVSVTEGSCAEKAGLRESDIIVAIDGKSIASLDELNAVKRGYRAGDSAVLRVYRGGEYVELTVVFDEETPEALESEAAAEAETKEQQQSQQDSARSYDSYYDLFKDFFGGNPFGW